MVALWVRGTVFVAIAWICLAAGGTAQTLTFPALTGRVVDPAGRLGEPERAALTESQAGRAAETTDHPVVVTMK